MKRHAIYQQTGPLTAGAIPVDARARRPEGDFVAAEIQSFWAPIALSIFAFLTFYFSTKPVQQAFDYSYRTAGAFLQGRLVK